MENEEFLRGYEAAYSEIFDVIKSGGHPEQCGGICRVCEVMRAVIEDTLINLGRVMSDDEFEAMAEIIAKVNVRMRNDQG